MSARHAIETIGLGRDYGDVRALEALDAAVATGSRVGVLGPTRMDYPTNLAAVRAVARYLTRMLEEDETAR